MTGEELFDEYRANLQKRKMLVKCWDDISIVEKSAWGDTARNITAKYLIEAATKGY
jgi:hypothetical protein